MKGVVWNWDEDAQKAFTKIKRRLTTAEVLGYPNLDYSYILDTDASDVEIGAVLSRVHDGGERVTA